MGGAPLRLFCLLWKLSLEAWLLSDWIPFLISPQNVSWITSQLQRRFHLKQSWSARTIWTSTFYATLSDSSPCAVRHQQSDLTLQTQHRSTAYCICPWPMWRLWRQLCHQAIYKSQHLQNQRRIPDPAVPGRSQSHYRSPNNPQDNRVGTWTLTLFFLLSIRTAALSLIGFWKAGECTRGQKRPKYIPPTFLLSIRLL